MRLFVVVTLCILGVMTSFPVDGSKILLVPFSHGGHVNFFSVFGETLHKKGGHEVYIVVSHKYEKLTAKTGIIPLVPALNVSAISPLEKEVDKEGSIQFLKFAPKAMSVGGIFAREMAEDKKFMKTVEDLGFDLMIMDGFDVARSIYFLPYKFGVPFISVTPRPDPWSFGIPAMPSVEGVLPMFIMSKASTVIDRAMNSFAWIVMQTLMPPSIVSPMVSDSTLQELVPEKENIGYRQLYYQSEMMLINMDIICLDFHRISSPYYQYIGGLGASDPKPLPAELESYMNKSTNGVIILTFGSAFKQIPKEMLTKILTAVKGIKQNIIMRHSGGDEVTDIPGNVKLTSWLPQNDLLAHPNTKLFITHAGNNGQLEAVYHGVPMLMMPLTGDQPYNAARAEKKGYGLTLDKDSFTSKQLKDTILELTENDRYYRNIKKCSRILHSLRSPQDTVLFWVNHVLEFGGSHLRPWYLELPLWKLFMLDVLLFYAILFMLLYKCLRYCCRKCRCCRRNIEKLTKKD